MGLLGFITLAAYFNKGTYPPRYLRNSIEGIVLIGVFGLFGFAFIDNAAHFGGLCGGLLLGWLLLRPYNQKPNEKKTARQATTLGIVALLILGLAALMAIYKIM
jgi:rhomboid protease GluP